MALFPGLPRWASTRKEKPIWILLKQETVSGSGISWAVCKSAPRSRKITMPAAHYSFFTGRMPFLPPNQQRQSTEGKRFVTAVWKNWTSRKRNKGFLWNFTSMTKIDVVLCVCKILFKLVQVCGGCCEMFRGLTFLGHSVVTGKESSSLHQLSFWSRGNWAAV